MKITRRALLGSTVAACALAGCTTSEVAAISAAAVTYLGDITSGLTALSPVLSTISAIPAATVTTIQGYFSQAVTVAKGINSSATAAEGASAVAAIENYINEALKLLAPYEADLPSAAQTVLTALQVVLPVLEAAVGLFTTASAPDPATLARAEATLRNARAALGAR